MQEVVGSIPSGSTISPISRLFFAALGPLMERSLLVIINPPVLNDLEKQGLILAWKTLKDFFEDRGNTEMYGSRDATREAFSAGIIGNGEI